ncbi:ATPase [Schleiferiaceae bacterium]|nr:ATPase [Schleiferiaceae bacterium]
MKSLVCSLALLSAIVLNGQSKYNTTTLEVDGLCGMCEERIENAAYILGVKEADWSQETHLLELIYNSSKVDEAAIIAAINEVGHDVKNHPATDEQYANIHGCCRFRDPDQRAKHGLDDPLCKPGETHEEHHAHGGKHDH